MEAVLMLIKNYIHLSAVLFMKSLKKKKKHLVPTAYNSLLLRLSSHLKANCNSLVETCLIFFFPT